MLRPYRSILSHPGAVAFASAGLLSRLPISMFSISMILMVQIQYDSYAIAGRVSAIGVIVWAAQTVPTARLTDRIGQRAAMIPLTGITVVGATLAVWTAMARGPEWALWIAAALGSLSGPLGSLTRARWSNILDSDEDIHTAFALEGALDEVLFIAGPAVATVVATVIWPPLGVIVCMVAMVIGVSILVSQRATEPPARSSTGGTGLGLRIPAAVFAVTLIAIGLGMMFGAFDISAVAFADERGHKILAGVVLGILSAGSLVGGLLYGSRRWKTPLWKRTVIGTALLALGFTAISLSPGLIAFAIIGFVAGAAVAPNITNADTVVQRVVARDQITEGMAWLRIGIGIGVAAGAWVAGYLIETSGARSGLYVAAGSAVIACGIALATVPWLRRGTERHGPGAPPRDPALDTLVARPPAPPLM